jgi:hypothetical protein
MERDPRRARRPAARHTAGPNAAPQNGGRADAPGHWTLTATVAFDVGAKVQLFTLLPPLEQAPEKIASRPFDAVSTIDAPDAKDAEAVLPTLTLIPAGDETTRSPLRPVAVTVTVTPCDTGGGVAAADGVTVATAVRVTPW